MSNGTAEDGGDEGALLGVEVGWSGSVAVMAPFHVARQAGDALDQCWCRVQQDLHGHRRKGGPLKKRAAEALVYFDRPGASNDPTEVINGRVAHLRGSVVGFGNRTHYIARSLLETGGFRPHSHPQLR